MSADTADLRRHLPKAENLKALGLGLAQRDKPKPSSPRYPNVRRRFAAYCAAVRATRNPTVGDLVFGSNPRAWPPALRYSLASRYDPPRVVLPFASSLTALAGETCGVENGITSWCSLGPIGSASGHSQSPSTYQSKTHSDTFPSMSYRPQAFGLLRATGCNVRPLFSADHGSSSSSDSRSAPARSTEPPRRARSHSASVGRR
jgi:hypothetical protein